MFLQPSPSKSKRESSFSPLKSENIIASSGLDKANLLNITFCSALQSFSSRTVHPWSSWSCPYWLSRWLLMLWRWSLWAAVHSWYHQKQWWWWYLCIDCLEHYSCCHSTFHTSPIQEATSKSHCFQSVLSKLLEKHVRNLLVDHCEEFYLLSVQQWGSTHGKSSTEALLAATDNWHRLLDSGLDVCIVFFNFGKVFDTVRHRPLLQKLKDVNVHSHIIEMVNSLPKL